MALAAQAIVFRQLCLRRNSFSSGNGYIRNQH
jgi:hypothetical protein